ncbi:MAG: F0F1 ATP synthase subunit alpha, partial [Chloroflexota bacterium]
MTIQDEVLSALQRQVEGYRFALQAVSVGTVTEVRDGVVRISGLMDIMVSELLQFDDETLGMALNLEEEGVGAIVLGPYDRIREGSSVHALGQLVSV